MLITGILVAGRSGSSFAARIGSMQVSQEVDALAVIGIEPVRYLVAPALVAMLVMLPVLTIMCDFVGILGGLVIAVAYVKIPAGLYFRTVWEQIAVGGFTARYVPNDFIQGLVKPLVFGLIIAVTACYFGIRTTGGTEGVGQATTRTVVTASITILIVDFFLTQILLSVFGPG